MSALAGAQMASLGMVDPITEDAMQPNGLDLTVAEVEHITGLGALLRRGKELPAYETVPTKWGASDMGRGWVLEPGAYVVRFTETVHMPADVMGYLRPRSTLLRCGAALHTGVVDAGYNGRMQCLLTVANPKGLILEVGARIAQLTAHRLEQAPAQGYAGQYQNEGLGEKDRLMQRFREGRITIDDLRSRLGLLAGEEPRLVPEPTVQCEGIPVYFFQDLEPCCFVPDKAPDASKHVNPRLIVETVKGIGWPAPRKRR